MTVWRQINHAHVAPGYGDPPVFSLLFRRYAPFDTFGGFIAGQRSDGDKRTEASTSLKVTSRTYGFLMFNRNGIVQFRAGSTGTTFHPLLFADIYAIATVSSTIVDHVLMKGPGVFVIGASTASSFPLTPAVITPDVNTYISAFIDFRSAGSLRISVSAHGDGFPNLEVFLLCGRSTHTAVLIDARTRVGRDTGPLLGLLSKNEDNPLGRYSVNWPLNKRGEAIVDVRAGPTLIGDDTFGDLVTSKARMSP